MKGRLDKFLNRWLSRKLMVFLVGCVALFSGQLESNDWVVISTAYIAFQGATDIVERLMKAKSGLFRSDTTNTTNIDV